VRLCGARGVPEGSLASIRIGSTRRQGPLGEQRTYRFSEVCGGKQHMKVDIFAPIAHAQLLIEPGEANYELPLLASAALLKGLGPLGPCFESAGEEAGVADEAEEETTDKVADSGMTLSFQVASCGDVKAFGPGGSHGAWGNGVAEGGSERSRRLAAIAAAKAQPYIEQHHLIDVMQALLQSVLKEKPEDPYAYMIKMLQNSSRAAAGKSQRAVRPQSAAAVVKGRAASAATLPSQMARPQSAAATVWTRPAPSADVIISEPLRRPASPLPLLLSPRLPATPVPTALPAAPLTAHKGAPVLGTSSSPSRGEACSGRSGDLPAPRQEEGLREEGAVAALRHELRSELRSELHQALQKAMEKGALSALVAQAELLSRQPCREGPVRALQPAVAPTGASAADVVGSQQGPSREAPSEASRGHSTSGPGLKAG